MIKRISEQNNPPKPSNFDIIFEKFRKNFPKNYRHELNLISDFVKEYITDSGFNIKFLNSCLTGYGGVRTKDQIIICSPSNIETIGDFIYTIFHEMRHEQQISEFKQENPWRGDLEDIEDLSEKYWELELDADRFAKSMIAKLILSTKIPIEIAQSQFKLSGYIDKYPTLSQQIKNSFIQLAKDIKKMRQSGEEISDIQDHPLVKKHLDKLENFI
jgi:hypothetical protein